MSVLLFIDESGHDHRNAPYEVRGGVALDADRLWPFVRAMKHLEESCFGDALHRFGKEIKGHKLLDKDRYKWAAQGPRMDDAFRRAQCMSFLSKGTQKGHAKPKYHRSEFTAYGQACLEMARGAFELLRSHGAKLFAALTPATRVRPDTVEADVSLRKNFVALLERYFNYLELRDETGLLVMDKTEQTEDRRFIRRLNQYFTHSHTGRYRSTRIVPTPLFVASDMMYPVRAAGLCIYCVNHAYQYPKLFGPPVREEIRNEYADFVGSLEFRGESERH